MIKYDCIFLDRDGTLNPDPGYINDLNDFSFYHYTISALAEVSSLGYRFCIITNQSGIGRGLIKIENLEKINNYISTEFSSNKIPLLKIYQCFDHPKNPTIRRKPSSGMYLEAAEDFNLNLTNCLMVGDSICDIEAGHNLGMDTVLVLTGNGEETHQILSDVSPTFVIKNISQLL